MRKPMTRSRSAACWFPELGLPFLTPFSVEFSFVILTFSQLVYPESFCWILVMFWLLDYSISSLNLLIDFTIWFYIQILSFSVLHNHPYLDCFSCSSPLTLCPFFCPMMFLFANFSSCSSFAAYIWDAPPLLFIFKLADIHSVRFFLKSAPFVLFFFVGLFISNT